MSLSRERDARDDLLSQIRIGDKVVITKGKDFGLQGEVTGTFDRGSWIGVEVMFLDNETETYRKNHVRKVWPGLKPEEHPVGGWAALQSRHGGRTPTPCVDQQVRHKTRGTKGRIVRVNAGSVLYASKSSTTMHAPESQLQVQNPDGSWSDFATDEVVRPAVPIRNLPDPFCQIREVRGKPDTDQDPSRWSAHDAKGNLIAHLNVTEARNLMVQLSWEFGS